MEEMMEYWWFSSGKYGSCKNYEQKAFLRRLLLNSMAWTHNFSGSYNALKKLLIFYLKIPKIVNIGEAERIING